MRVLQSIALGLLLCEPLLLRCAIGEVLPIPQAATGRPTEHVEIEALQKLAEREGESGQTIEAIRDYKRVLELRPDWKEGWWNLGVLQYGDNHFADARSTLQHVVEFAPRR